VYSLKVKLAMKYTGLACDKTLCSTHLIRQIHISMLIHQLVFSWIFPVSIHENIQVPPFKHLFSCSVCEL